MAGTDFEYRATLDDSEVLKALKRIDTNISNLASQAGKGFSNVGQSANLSSVKIGAIGGIVGGLTNQFIEMGKQAVQVLVNVGERSVQTALEFDTLRKRLLGIFDGSEEAATAAFDFIREKSKALGIDLGELAGAFLPKVESLNQFERVAKIATALAASDPEQGAIGARIALIEALSGTFTSLQRRFEIPKEDIDKIKEAFDARGIEGFLDALDKTLKESGKDFDTLADTAQTSFNQLGQIANEKLGQLGDPIVESLQRAAEDIGAFLNQNDADITLFVTSIGDAIASVIDYIGSIDLSQLDTKSLVEFGQYIFRIVEATKLFIGQAVGFLQSVNQIFEQVTVVDEVLGFLADTLSRVNEALVTASQILALSKAGFEAIYATIQPLVKVFSDLFSALGYAVTGNFSAAANSLNSAVAQINEGVLDLDAGLAAAAKSLQTSAAAMEEYDQAIDGQADSQEKLRTELEDTSKAGEDAANAFLKQKQDAKDAAKALDEYEAALEKVNEEQAKFETELEQRGSDINLDTERKRFDAIQEFADKRAKATRGSLQKIEDIEREYSRDLEDDERDRAREFIDQAKDEAKERLGVEEDYQEQLADIREQSFYDLEDAARNRDAIAYIRILRDQQKQVQDAETNRDRDLEDVQLKGEEKRAELRTQQEREEEDARIATDRKLEDNRIALDREFSELQLGEQAKKDEINLWQQRQLEDLNIWGQRKQEALNQQLAAELEIIKAYEQQKTEVIQEEVKARSSLQRRTLDRDQQSTIDQQISEGRTVLAGRATGGPVTPGQSYLVGERGPEVFSPAASGYILPNTPGLTNPFVPGNTSYSTVNNTTNSINQSMLSPGEMSATMRQIARNEALAMLEQFVGKK